MNQFLQLRRSLLVICLIFIHFLSAQIIYVPGDYSTIQEGIDAAVNSDTVLVSEGEYIENLNMSGKNIVLCSQYALSDDPADILNTIINGSDPIHPDTASCILIISGEDSSCVIQGFTITAGTGTIWEDEHGPGNFYREGGGILIQYSSPTIKNNRFIGNEALDAPPGIVSAGGGGIRCGDGNPTITNNTFLYNLALYGAGIVLNYSDATILNNIIAHNSGGDDYGGGGIWSLSNGTNPVIIANNTIVYNNSNQVGGGIRLWSSTASVMNNIIWGNTATSAPQIHGGMTLFYNCIEGGFTGEGNIDQNPLFLSDQFILDPTSPCIDAGNPQTEFNDPEDPSNPGFALYPSQGGLTNDMGVYGGPLSMEMTSVMTGNLPSSSIKTLPGIEIWPNPVGDRLNIRISTDTPLQGKVKLLTIQARILETADLKTSSTSETFAMINMDAYPSGFYLVEIIIRGQQTIEKVLKP